MDKRRIFLDEKDHFRFVHDLFEFNDKNNLISTFRNHLQNKNYIQIRPRELLVDIHAFCLMPNHYHLLLSPHDENNIVAISKFMQKLNMGYAQYFNKKYERSGALFQGKYKRVLIKNDEHFLYLPHYIHLNPLDLIAPEWREGKIVDYKKAIDFLKNYRWSSFLDYAGKKNFPLVIYIGFLSEVFEGTNQYDSNIMRWIKDMFSLSIDDIILE